MTRLAPHSHTWGQSTQIISNLPPKRDWGPKRMKGIDNTKELPTSVALSFVSQYFSNVTYDRPSLSVLFSNQLKTYFVREMRELLEFGASEKIGTTRTSAVAHCHKD